MYNVDSLLQKIQNRAPILQDVVDKLTLGNKTTADEKDFLTQLLQPGTSKDNTLSETKAKWKRLWKCEMCSKEFPYRARLKEHIRKHTGEKPFVCSICSKGFIKNSDLNRHKLIHSTDMAFMCIDCGKCFSRLCNMRTHSRTHTGDRPYACSYCEKCFTRKDYLNEHERVHTGAKPYTCNMCGKSFARPQDVSRHIKTHSSEKPYGCTVCGKSYKQRRSLTVHRQTHTIANDQSVHVTTKCHDGSTRHNNGISEEYEENGGEKYSVGTETPSPGPIIQRMVTKALMSSLKPMVANSSAHFKRGAYDDESPISVEQGTEAVRLVKLYSNAAKTHSLQEFDSQGAHKASGQSSTDSVACGNEPILAKTATKNGGEERTTISSDVAVNTLTKPEIDDEYSNK